MSGLDQDLSAGRVPASIDREKLVELRERVRGLTGADREVDGQVHNATFGTHYIRVSSSVTGFLTSRTDNGCPMVPNYTSSVDAALALVERVLPGAWWCMAKGRLSVAEPLFGVELLREGTDDDSLGIGEGATLPVAIILATLSALIEAHHDTTS